MKNTSSNLKTAAIASSIIVLPFLLLEIMFNKITARVVPDLAVLLGLLWLMAVTFIVLMMPIAQNLWTGKRVLANPVTLLLRVASSAVLVMVWVSIVVDQLPCFLGVPNCD